MANLQYIGARYVPVFADPIEWQENRSYEPLTIVTYLNSSYTSKKDVPAGVNPSNAEYWANTGNYNAQIEDYRELVMQYAAQVEALRQQVTTLGGEIVTTNQNLQDLQSNVNTDITRIENTANKNAQDIGTINTNATWNAGDSIIQNESTGAFIACGYITGNSQQMLLEIPLNKPLNANIRSTNITDIGVEARGLNGYSFGSSGYKRIPADLTLGNVYVDRAVNLLRVTLSKADGSTFEGGGNTPITASIGYLKLNFS